MLRKQPEILKNNAISERAQNESSRLFDFYDILESVAWLWRFFGVFPMTVRELMGIKRYEINKLFAVLSVIIFVLRIGNFTYVMINFDEHFCKESFRITSATILVRAIGNISCMFASTVYRIPQLSVLSESINAISEQDLFLNKMNCRPYHESCVKIIRVCVWTTLLAVLFFIAYDIYGIRRYYNIVSPEYILWHAGLFVQIIDFTVFATLVGLLGLNFYNLNEKIRSVVTRANASSPKVLVTSDVCAEQLRFISEIHYNMCAVGKRINRVFDWNVVINVMVAFIVVSTTLYYIFYEVQRAGPTDLSQIFAYIHWELYHSVPIVMIVIVCNLTSHQSVRAGKLIHEIRVESTDSELYQAVKSFSLQLHHQKLQFTAGGFFPVDSTLLQTMIGKITTYLVILIQFKPKLE
ncbi:gustatory receptor family protein 3-like [Venturia canescens]|uniref:gustatory receptor family protein 3-like n=1 Tax=Venturia canescens TaxID=32260 RepID=UPI001C9D3E05|nr:gustatory receptor family protein 3-like [Venturia canescens]